mgnify:CR=1 FL=1
MGLGKTYSTQYLADSDNNTGVAGQVLISTADGINWIDIGSVPGTLPGGPYLPLTAGSTVPVTGPLYLQPGNADVIISGTTGGNVTIDNNAGSINFQANGSTVNSMTITSTQISLNEGVTINSTSLDSANKLQVAGQARIVGNMMIGNSSVSNVAGQLLHIKSSGAPGIRIEDSDADNLAFDITVNEGAGFEITETTGGDAGNDLRMIIEETTGFVGFGTASPSAPLNVFAGTNESLYDVLGVYNSITGTAALNNGAAIRIGRDVDGSYSAKIATIYEGNNPGYLQPALAFYTMYNTNLKDSETEKMRISANGNVGIGFTGPGASPLTSFKLSVNGNAYVAGDLGVGTVLPASKLEVSGDFSIQQSLYWNNGYNPTTGAGVANGFDIAFRTGITTLDTALSYKVSLTTNGTGTDTGSCWLVGYTQGSATWSVRMVSQGGSTSNHPLLAIDSTGTKMVAYTNHSSSYPIRWHCETTRTGDPDSTLHNYGGDFHWQRNVNELIYTDGNVGINTTSTNQKLHVNGGTQLGDINAAVNFGTVALKVVEGTVSTGPTLGSGTVGAQAVLYSNGQFGMYTGVNGTTGDTWMQSQRNDTGTAAYNILLNPIGGKVGIGTASPGATLEVKTGTSAGTVRLSSDGNGAIFSANGDLQFYTNNTAYATKFYSANKASTLVTILDSGKVGIGITTNTTIPLHVNQVGSGTIFKASGIQAQIEIETSTAGDAHLYMRPNSTGNNAAIFKMTAGTNYNWRWQDDATTPVVFMQLSQSNSSLSVKGDIIAYGSPSDERYKENIKPIESALDKVTKLQGVTFDWKKSDNLLDIKEDIGFIAQDVQKVVPELVRENEDGKLSLRYQGITPILLEAIKELKAEIEELKKQIK